MKLPLFFLLSFLTFHTINAQNYDWGKKWGYNAGTTDLVFAMDIASDNLGNTYVLSFGDTQVDFDPSAGTLMGPTVACGAISKFDTDGNLTWVKFISRVSGTSPSCTPEAIHISNNVLYIAGKYNGTYDFNPGVGVNTLSTATARIFIQQLDLDGNFIGANSYLDFSCSVKDIVTDDNQNIFITGDYGQNISFGSSNLVINGLSDVYLAKIETNGNPSWAVGYGGGAYDNAMSVAVKSNGNVIFIGAFSGSVDFDPTIGTNIQVSNNGSRDFFLQELNTSGLVLNTITGGGIDSDGFNSVFIDDLDNIFIGGYLNGFVDLDPSVNTNMIGGSGQVGLVAKYNSSLNFLWGSVFENQSVPTSSNSVLDLLVDQSSNIYLSGRFGGTIDLNTNLSQSQFITAGGTTSNSFFAKLNSNGQTVWSGGFIGITDGYNVPNGIAYGNGGVYVAGEFKSTVDFDPSINTANFTSAYSSNGVVPKETAYLVKLTTCSPSTSMISPVTCGPYTSPDGAVYSNSGNYIAVIPNSNGCDSTISIDLTINGNSSSTINELSCINYTAPDGQIYSQTGVYSAVIANTEGCDSLITINLTIQNVNAGISVSGITMSATNSGMQYQWLNCVTNEIIGLPTTQSFTPSTNGEYAVIVYDGNCSDTSDCITISSVSLIENQISNFTISPNPVTGFALIEGISNTLANEIELITSAGILVRKYEINGEQFLIDMSDVAAGIYFIKIEGWNPLKVIKQ